MHQAPATRQDRPASSGPALAATSADTPDKAIEEHMQPPASLPPGPGPAPASPGAVAAGLARHLAGHGITGVYTAATIKVAVISVTAGLTVWTDGRRLWCVVHGQRRSWPAADLQAASTSIAALARPASP
jgi:hypothetical protein